MTLEEAQEYLRRCTADHDRSEEVYQCIQQHYLAQAPENDHPNSTTFDDPLAYLKAVRSKAHDDYSDACWRMNAAQMVVEVLTESKEED